MKKLVFYLFGIVFFGMVSCSETPVSNEDLVISTELVTNPVSAEGVVDEATLPKFKFEVENYDFGVVVQGEKVSYVYKYENVGGSDLIISNVKASCGCTIPNWSKEPLSPNGKGEIELVFDSSGKRGVQHKTVTILANSQPNTIKLGFTAEVLVPGN